MKESKIFLQHILECIGEIEIYTKGFSKKELSEDMKTKDAVLRRLGIVGEAARNLPTSLKDKNPDIPWKKIIGMRNVLIHEYFDLDEDVIWITIKEDLPELKKKIEKIYRVLSSNTH